jgi:hypothetical protein
MSDDIADGLDPDERRALEQLLATCNSQKKKSVQLLQQCALAKHQVLTNARADEANRRADAAEKAAILAQKRAQAAEKAALIEKTRADSAVKLARAASRKADSAGGAARDAFVKAVVVEERQNAMMLVCETMSGLHTAGLLIQGAITKAAMDYDNILQAQASKPILGDILLNLAILALPEIGILRHAMGAFKPGRNQAEFLAKLEEVGERTRWFGDMERKFDVRVTRWLPPDRKTMDAMLPIPDHFELPQNFVTIVDRTERRSDDIVAAIRGPITGSADLDAASQARSAAYAAKNSLVAKILGDLSERLLIAQSLEQKLFAAIALSSECDLIVVQVKKLMTAAGFGAISMSDFASVDLSSEKSAYQTLCAVVLYDMLKSYAAANVGVEALDGLLENVPEDTSHDGGVTGFNRAQLQMIYDRFRKPPWSDPSRPPVGNLRQLAKNWAKVEPSDGQMWPAGFL